MDRLLPEERYQIVKIFFENNGSIRETYRKLRPIFGLHGRPTERSIRRLMDKFRTEFTLLDTKHPTRVRNVRTEATIDAVNESVTENPNLSIRRRAQQLVLCPSTTWKILRKDLCLVPYKIQLVQELKPRDHGQRRTFANWAQQQLAEDPLFYRKIVFSDEAHFWLNGYVNKQNCRFWSESNPHEVLETTLHPEKCTVWCGIHAGGIIGPFFFKNQAGANVTVNGERYRAMINNFLFHNLEDIDADQFWFQQDGATAHTSAASIDLLKTVFGDRVISRFGPVNWPPRSCDLTPPDFFLWGYVKSLVYADKPDTLEALEANIVRVIDEIQPDTLERVLKNWTDRLEYIQRSRGGHMHEIVFKH